MSVYCYNKIIIVIDVHYQPIDGSIFLSQEKKEEQKRPLPRLNLSIVICLPTRRFH